jgi:hypothetical protein
MNATALCSTVWQQLMVQSRMTAKPLYVGADSGGGVDENIKHAVENVAEI